MYYQLGEIIMKQYKDVLEAYNNMSEYDKNYFRIIMMEIHFDEVIKERLEEIKEETGEKIDRINTIGMANVVMEEAFYQCNEMADEYRKDWKDEEAEDELN